MTAYRPASNFEGRDQVPLIAEGLQSVQNLQRGNKQSNVSLCVLVSLTAVMMIVDSNDDSIPSFHLAAVHIGFPGDHSVKEGLAFVCNCLMPGCWLLAIIGGGMIVVASVTL